MITTAEKVLFLKGVELFADLPGEDLAPIAAVTEEIVADEGAEIIREGAAGDSLYLVAQGRVRVSRGPAVVTELGEREVFGEMAILDPAPRSATVRAVTPVVLLRLSRDAFTEILADRPEIAQGIIRVLTRRLRAATK